MPTLNYTMDANNQVSVGLFNTSPMQEFIAGLTHGAWTKYEGTNINTLYPASQPEYADISPLETEINKPLTNWANKWGYDRFRKRIVGIGTAEGYFSSYNTRGKAVTFNLDTDAFSVDYAPLAATQSEGHIYDRNSSIPDKFGRFWCSALSGGGGPRLWYRDPDTGDYIYSDRFNFQASENLFALDVFPDMGVDGSVILFSNRGSLIRKDINTGAVTLLQSYETDNRFLYGVCNYNAATQSIIFGGGNNNAKMFKLDKFGVITEFLSTTPHIISAQYNGKYISSPSLTEPACYSFFSDTMRMYRHDIVNDTWVDIGPAPATAAGTLVQTVFIPLHGLNAIACFHGRGRTSGVPQSEFWIYKV